MFIVLFITMVLGGEVYTLTPKSFHKVVNGTNILVRFCPLLEEECRKSQSDFESLADSFEEYEDDVVFGQIDCSQHADFCDEMKMEKKFPIYVAYTNNSQHIQIYPMSGTDNDLKNFIYQAFQLSDVPLVYTKLLSDRNFNKTVLDPEKNVVILFYRYWCAYSRLLMPIVEKVARNYANENDLVIARIDCTTYPEICKQNRVDAIPEIKRYTTYDKLAFEVKIDRTIEALTNYINQQFMKDRDTEGIRPKTFGTWYVFDELAKDFVKKDKETQLKNIKICDEYLSGVYYSNVMRKIMEEGNDDFVPRDLSELKYELSSKKEILSPKEIDVLTRKINVITKFLRDEHQF